VLREQSRSVSIFFQACACWGGFSADRQPSGSTRARARKCAFRNRRGFRVPTSQIARSTGLGRAAADAREFHGPDRPQGLLPLYYSALVRERLRARDSALREFLDIFNHRAVSLFYQAWEKFRFTVAYERGDDDRLSPHLMDCWGWERPGCKIASRSRRSAGLPLRLLAAQTRSAAALRLLLMDYFEVPVEIEQFVARGTRWRKTRSAGSARPRRTPSNWHGRGSGDEVGIGNPRCEFAWVR